MTTERFLDLEITDCTAFLEALIRGCPNGCALEVEGRFSKSVLRSLERFDRKRCRVGRQSLFPVGRVRSYRVENASRQPLIEQLARKGPPDVDLWHVHLYDSTGFLLRAHDFCFGSANSLCVGEKMADELVSELVKRGVLRTPMCDDAPGAGAQPGPPV